MGARAIELTRKDVGRFYTFFVPGIEDQCWKWLGTCPVSYGLFRIGNSMVPAHRVAYLIERGPFDFSLDVCHTCDNPPCVNPTHLFLGTALDNVRDCIDKGRFRESSGEQSSRCKFSDATLEELRALHATGLFTQVQLAKEFNISYVHLNNILRGAKR